MDSRPSASRAPCFGAETMLHLSPNSEDSSGGSDCYFMGLFDCDMCVQYLKHVALYGGESLDEEGLTAAKILAGLAQGESGYTTGYAHNGGERLHGSIIESGESSGAGLGGMAPAQPIHQTESGAGAFRDKKSEGQKESSARGRNKA